MVGPQRKKPGLPIARSLLSTFIADPPPSSHPQAHRGRGKGRGRGARGANAKRNPVRPVSHAPVSKRVEDEPVSHSPMSEERVDEWLSLEEDEDRLGALTADDENDGFIQVEKGRPVYMRGSSRLPERGLPIEQRPCIAPYGER